MLSETSRRPIYRSVVEIGIFSAVLNVLLLVPPLYMLQIYDRVLASSSMNTLTYMTIFAVGALCVLGVLEIVRAYYASRVASRLDTQIGPAAFHASMTGPRAGLGDIQALRDLSSIRAFISSRSIFFLFDLPFAPLFIGILYFIHPVLFWVTVGGAVLMIGVAVANQWATAAAGKASAESLNASMGAAQSFARGFETIRALGMLRNVGETWGKKFADALEEGEVVAARNALFGGLSRTIRMLLQLAVLGVGAYLVLDGKMTAGMIFASSIISGRALQPLDQIVGGWRQIIEAHRAWKRLTAIDESQAAPAETVSLPKPTGTLTVDQLVYFTPDGDPTTPFIKRLSFRVEAGESVAIIGPSRAGKSTLARLIVGAIRPHSGAIRLDGADIRNWNSDDLGRHLGYLPQEVELFPGTIADNIARLDPDRSDEAVVAAAELAQAHPVIVAQKKAYMTEIGPGAVRLSGGERQRIGLARAFYGEPRLLVLDEPNASLDSEGEQALEKAMAVAREKGITLLLITHKVSIASRCDRVLFLREGQIELYGPAMEVLARLQQGTARPAQAAPAQGQAQGAAAAQPALRVQTSQAGAQ